MKLEVLSPSDYTDTQQPKRQPSEGTLGFLGIALALLTMLTAAGVGFVVLFGRTLLSALVTMVLWPFIFSPQFTQWVFGAPRAEFRKLFLLYLTLAIIVKLFRPLDIRRPLWQKK